MAERGQRTQVLIGGVAAEVSLVKASARPREAQHETRRVPSEAVVDGRVDEGRLARLQVGHRVDVVTRGGPAPDVARGTLELRGADGELRDVGRWDDAPPLGDPLGDPEPDPPATPAAGGPAFEPLPEQEPKGELRPLDPTDPEDWRRATIVQHAFGAGAAGEQPAEEVRHGVWVESGEGREWVDLTDSLAAIDERTRLVGMELAATVSSTAVPRHRVRDAYFVAPAGRGAPKVLALLWRGLREKRAAGLVRWTKRTNQALGALVPVGTPARPVLMLLELAWAAEVREAPARAVLSEAASGLTDQECQAALSLVEAYHERPSVFEALRDERNGQRADLLNAAREGAEWEPPAPVAAPELDAFEAAAR